MSEKKEPELRKVYSFDDMGEVDRDGFDLFGTEYAFVGPQDVGGQFMADARAMQERIPEIESQQADSEDEEEQVRLSEELIRALMQMTQVIFVEEVPEKILMKMSVRHHRFVHDSFTAASAGDGGEPAEAMEKTEEE